MCKKAKTNPQKLKETLFFHSFLLSYLTYM